ncbi:MULTISPECIES: hypothetical protein [Kocuria]|uniref:hypothetical protein n=1 Tax=Kocuria TaxID=57493 RepID=UPI0013938E54|nr:MULTISPECIES: hypothetical protein [Kocuria]MCT1545560.1 hypothetical protein [Kocuria rhizophila]MCT2171524.1 hypothetical protein [Kocuria rhizophila]MDN3461951.1 hypothetical protein [Kocuria sp. APC 4018]MXN63240.1 hypothetical protein [Bacillus sp. BGMRC0062]
MTQHPENSDPIASAGQIDDPDQPTTVHGKDDSRAGRDTQPEESSADGDPEQPGTRHRSGAAPHHDAAPAASATRGTAQEGRTATDEHDGKPPKALRETGFPVVDEGTVDAQHNREVDSEALAGTRKFQPRPGDANPNVSDNPADRLDTASGVGRARSTEDRRHDGHGQPETSGDHMASEHVAGPRGGVPDGAVQVEADGSGTDRRTMGEADRAGAGRRGADEHGSRDERASRDDAGQDSTAQYETPESIPEVEPVRHSRIVEERVQEQERDFDLGTTEEGERYLTPRDVPGA